MKSPRWIDLRILSLFTLLTVYLLTFFATFMGFFDSFQYPKHDELLEQYFTDKSWNFITRDGYKLFDGNKRFRWASYNVPNLLLLEDRNNTGQFLYGFPICKFAVSNPSFDSNGYGYGVENGESCIIPKNGESDPPEANKWICPTPDEQEDAILSVKGSGGQVIRTYTLGFGSNYHVRGPGSFNEKAFVAMDNALAIARKHRIRLVIPFINNHDGGDRAGLGNFGDYLSMCQFRSLNASDFYTNRVLREDFKDIITFVLQRINTINGVRYKDDPTILAWQLGNELGGWAGDPPPSDWTIEMASHLKALAPSTLVMDGTFGGHYAQSRYSPEVLNSPSIDIISNHYYYGNEDMKRIQSDAALVASKYKKSFIIGEFGFEFKSCRSIFDLVKTNDLISGAMIWSLRYHSRDGGFYIHSEDGGYNSFHVPGFEIGPGFHSDEISMVKAVRHYGYAIQGINPKKVPFPTPHAPKKVASFSCTPRNICWFGSAWAASYDISRTFTGSEQWLYLGRVSDGIKSGSVLFNDTTASPNTSYTYRIVPLSADLKPNYDAALELELSL